MADDALQKAHDAWVAARTALDEAETSGTPPLLSEARWTLVDRERDAYDALTEAQIASLRADEES